MTEYTKHDKVLEGLVASQNADSDMRDNAREAHLFIEKRDGQWEPYWWNLNENRPRYTFDMTGPIVDQIAGEMELADFDITVRPAGGDTTKDDAKLYDGMIRNIENISNAKDIFDLASRNMVCAGIDGWQIKHKYIDDDSFDQDLVIEPIANFIDSVWFGPFKKPDGSDAPWVIVLEAIPTLEYEDRWPEASGQGVSDDRLAEAYYQKEDQIIVGQIYYIEPEERELLLMSSGRVLENTEETQKVLDELAAGGETIVNRRMRPKNVVKSRLFDGDDWLGKAQKTVFNQLPVIPCIANFKIFENKVLYRGVVEKLLDAQRVFNYAKSREIEEGALAPRAKYWMTLKQSEGHEKELATMNTNADPMQHFNADPENPGAPQQNGGAVINPGLQTISADMNGVIRQTAGLFAASMGDNPNVQSGVALKRLQDKGDTGTIKYFKARERAIARTGRILVDAIPVVYDTQRQVRIMKEDGSFDMTTINQPVQDQQTGALVTTHDVTKGKYDVTCSSGPAFQNRQEETVTAITEMMAVDPMIAEIGGDILFSNIASPGMDLLADRKRKQIFESGAIPEDQQTDEELQITEYNKQNPPPPDPMTIAANAEAEKAQADKDAVVVKMQVDQSREGRENFLANHKVQKETRDMAAKDRDQAHDWQIGEAQLALSGSSQQFDHKYKTEQLAQSADQQQFSQMMDMQQALLTELTTQASVLKVLTEALAPPEATKAQAGLVKESQADQE